MVAENYDFADAITASSQAVRDHDAFAHAAIVQELMDRSASYTEMMQNGKGPYKPVKSQVNGDELPGVKHISKEEYIELFARSKAAQAIWAEVPVSDRMLFMKTLAEQLKIRSNEISHTIIANVGKSLNDTKGENAKAAEWTTWAQDPKTAALFAPKITKDALGVPTDIELKKPAGVVGVMTSFNYPLALSIAGIVPALISGNSVVFKAASDAPHWAYFFHDAFRDAMKSTLERLNAENLMNKSHWVRQASEDDRDLLVNGLFSVINGRDNTMIHDVDNLFFVGGTDTGYALKAQRDAIAADTGRNLTTHLELGGNSAAIVMDSAFDGLFEVDAKNEKAAEIAKTIFAGAIGNSGQRCTGARLLVLENTPLPELVLRKTKTLYRQDIKVGDPYDPETISGALVDKKALARMQRYIEVAKNLQTADFEIHVIGGEVLGDNQAPAGHTYVKPALIDWSRLSNEVLDHKYDLGKTDKHGNVILETLRDALSHETFAPLLNVVQRVRSKEEAVERVHAWDQERLAAGVFSNVADFAYLQKNLQITSVKKDSAPKDQSPKGEHGNYGAEFHTGGEHAFDSFTRVETHEHDDLRQLAEKLAKIHDVGAASSRAA